MRFTLVSAFLLLVGSSSSTRLVAQRNITVAASFPLETIRNDLFGLDLEFTRHDIWDGLSAELISNRLFAIQPLGTTWPTSWPENFPPRWVSLPGGSAPSVTNQSISCSVTAAQPSCGLVQLPVGDGFDAGMSFGSAIGIEAGRGYTFSAVVRASGTVNGAGQLQLSVVLAPALFAVNFSVPDTGGSGEWTTLTYSFVAGITTMRADSLTLSITTSHPQGTLSFNATSLLPNDNFMGMRLDAVDALADLLFSGPLRYPGGCYAPFYKWKNGLLPLLTRPTSFTPSSYCTAVNGGVNAYSDGFLQNGPGIDEYIALTNHIGATPAISIALQYGTPQEITDARDLVEYCNGDTSTIWGALRASRGHPEIFNVRIWYLGNEISSQSRWPDYPDQPLNETGPMTGPEYAAALETLIPALRAVDSSLTLLVVDGGVNFNTPAWVSQDFTPFISATSSHVGYANSDENGSPTSNVSATNQAKIPTTKVLDDITAVRAFLGNVSDGSAQHIKISVDEWGLGPPWVVKDFGVTHAMFGASFITMVLNSAIELGIGYTNYFEPINEGAIQVLQFSVTPTPLGVVMPMFGALAGTTRLSTSQSPGDDDDDIICVAAISEAKISLILSNRNSTDGFLQWVHFDGIRLASNATVTTLMASGGIGPGSFFGTSINAVDVSSDGWTAIELPAFSIVSVTAYVMQ